MNCSGLCMFHGMVSPTGAQSELIRSVTGMDFDDKTALETGKPHLEILEKIGHLEELIADMYEEAGETV